MFISKLRKILTLALLIAAAVGVSWSYGFQRGTALETLAASEAAAIPDEPKKDAKEKPEKNAKKEDRLTALRKERLDALRTEVKGLQARIQAGRDSLADHIQAYTNLMEAELVLCSTQAQRLAPYKDALDRFQILEKLRFDELAAGKGTAHQCEQVRAARLAIEIRLEEAKAKKIK